MDLSRYARLNAFPRPTPLEEMPRLRAAIGCRPRLFVKRDDTTIVGLGGNKTRKLDFVMAEALAQGADVAVTTAGVQSNHCRQTLAFARRCGMECHLVLTGDEPAERQGNVLIFTILGAKMHFIGEERDPDAYMAELAAQLRQQGRRPAVIPIGASTPLGALGYVESVLEVAEQAGAAGVAFGHAFLPSGSAGTQAGAEVGARAAYPNMRIHGVSVSRDASGQQAKVAELTNETFAFLGLDMAVTPADIIVHDEYYGGRYGVPTPAGIAAIKLLGRTEGLITDPVYTGKALSGMIDLLKKGRLDDAEAVLFFHTGGFPAVFAQADQFQRE
ncbi:MAG: D-cysteine desulfhydrase family protein [Bacillota bacterium]|nr:D-cysteine desulfhydrase family protein [Bacillota bacterium]